MTPEKRYLSLNGNKIPVTVENGIPALKSKILRPNGAKWIPIRNHSLNEGKDVHAA